MFIYGEIIILISIMGFPAYPFIDVLFYLKLTITLINDKVFEYKIYSLLFKVIAADSCYLTE